MSDELTLSSMRALVYGPPDRSKTFSSITLSEYCPDDLDHIRRPTVLCRSPRVVLEDMLWLAFDKGATDGFEEQGIVTPEIDMSTIQDLRKLPQELDKAAELIQDRVVANQTKALVVDTLASLNELIDQYNQHVRGLGGYDLYRAILSDHKRFAHKLKALPCHIVYLAHAKPLLEQAPSNSDAAAIVARNTARTRAAAGLASIVPSVTGQALNYYRAECTFQFAVTRARNKPEKGQTSYFFNGDHRDFEAKRRLSVPDTMPADWRVVFKHIAKGDD